jgi:hypothetical protein
LNGHDPLRAMRRARVVPRCVWVTDGDEPFARDWHEQINCTDQQRHAVIGVAAGDIPEALDFRCVVGLEVHLSAERGEARGRRLHAALIEAGARKVITSIHADNGINLLLHGVSEHG